MTAVTEILRLSWWDHYGPAACVAAFFVGFMVAFILWWFTYKQAMDDLKAAREDARWERNMRMHVMYGTPLDPELESETP